MSASQMPNTPAASAKTSRVRKLLAWLKSRPGALWTLRSDIAWATLSGVAVFLSFPAWNVFPLAFCAVIPLLVVCERASWKTAFGLAWWMGLVTNLGGFYWVINLLQDYGYMPWSLSAFLYLLLCMQQALVWSCAIGVGRAATLRGVPALPAYVTGIVLSESLIPLIFPWHFGNSQSLNYAFIQSAELGGVVWLSALLMVANFAVWGLFQAARSRRRPSAGVALACAAIVANFAYGAIRIPQVEADIAAAPTLNVGLVQANIGIYEKGDSREEPSQLIAHQRLSALLEGQGAELIVWPETAYSAPQYAFTLDDGDLRLGGMLARDATSLPPSQSPLPSSAEEDAIARVPPDQRYAPQRGFTTPLLAGVVMLSQTDDARAASTPPRGGSPRRYDVHNAAMLLDSDGVVLGSYDKTYRMVFSEYVPGGHWLWSTFGINLYDMIPAAGDFYPGVPTDGLLLPTDDGDVRIGIMICYEDIMPDFGRAIHSGRPEMLLNLTNDAWFGDTAEPELHLALSVFRAIEQRTTLVRSTNTGISAFIDPTGRIVASTPTFEEATLLHPVPRMNTTTLYMRLGNWVFGGALLWLALAWGWARRRNGAAS